MRDYREWGKGERNEKVYTRVNASPPQHKSASTPLSLFLTFALSLTLASCANPRPPSGGPRDQTPPAVINSAPQDGAVNVSARSIRLSFSEYIEQSTFTQAFSVTPQFEGHIEIDWDGRDVTLTFPEPLRENTTYILTLDTNLSDAHGVELDAPLTIAFSTGPTINKGRISGHIRNAVTGQSLEGVDVYAYTLPDTTAPALPESLPPHPAYRTQTGSEGTFQFDYLAAQPYFVIALRDNNRNRLPDPPEPYAAPPQGMIQADSAGTELDAPWVLTTRDTIPPAFLRTRPQSQRRLRLQFDEPVRLVDRAPDRWILRDSTRDRRMTVEAVYHRTRAPDAIYVRTQSLQPSLHQLLLPDAALTDTSGNALRPDTARFIPSPASDTLQTRFVAFLPENLSPDTAGVYTLWPDETPAVRFNEPLDSTRLHETLAIQDASGQSRPFTPTTTDGTTYRLTLHPPLQAGQMTQVRVDGRALANVDTSRVRTFRRISTRDLGSLSGSITYPASVDSTTAGSLIAEVYRTGSSDRFEPHRIRADSTGRFLFTNLPEGSYRFRAFLDRNGNGTWDGGQLLPYRPPEPVTWSSGTIDNRPRWENVLEDALRIPLLGSQPADAP